MSDTLEFAPGSRGSRGRLKTVITRVSGDEVLGRSEQFFDSDAHFGVAARFLGVKPVTVMKAFDRYHRLGETSYLLESAAAIERKPLTFSLRAINGSSFSEHEDLDTILLEAGSDQALTIEWEGVDRCCCLDMDFHAGVIPDLADVLIAGETLKPAPSMWWVSKSGGLHAVYFELDGFSAEELAGCCGAALVHRFPSCSVELKHATRPPYGELIRCEQTSDLPSIALPICVDTAAFQPWLEERELEPGKRYPHTKCPVMPSARAEANTPPVVVYIDHIYCHICAADGVKRGSNTPGYFPLARLTGQFERSMFDRCVQNFTHWGHARHVATMVVRQENLAKCVYHSALRRRHGTDPRLPLVFGATPKTGLVRYDGYWAGDSGRPKTYDRTSPVLIGLPVCLRLDDDGDLKPDMRIVEELASTDDLSSYGYPALTRVWGLQLTQFQDLPANRIFKPIQRNGVPTYLPHSARLAREDAWARVAGSFPGVDRAAVELLIVAKGCSEHHVGLPPMVFLTGPTGAGKTQTVNLAAAICGDSAAKVLFHPEQDRVRRGVLKAKETGSYAFFDEYLKSAKASKTPPDDAMELLLSLEPDSVSHVLYVGPVPLGDLPACVWADTIIPSEVANHAQIGRRLHHIPLAEARDGWCDARDLRQMGTDVVRAADSILSWAVDDWFGPGPGTDFAEVAKALGFKLLCDSTASDEKSRLIRQLYALVCSAQPLTGAERRRWPEDGWVMINLSDDRSELTECWKWLADARDHGSSRAVSESDLKRVLGLTHPARLEVSRSGNKVAIRFIGDGGKCNGALELVTIPPSVHGHRDAECSGPEEVGFPSLPQGCIDAADVGCLPDR